MNEHRKRFYELIQVDGGTSIKITNYQTPSVKMEQTKDTCKHCRDRNCISATIFMLNFRLRNFDDLTFKARIQALIDIGKLLMEPCGANLLSKQNSLRATISDKYKQFEVECTDEYPECSTQFREIIKYIDAIESK